jgi:2-polyprenyl-3-methyl-5-hydroxy-6-metoxy-1,4-benzoquinol methylase
MDKKNRENLMGIDEKIIKCRVCSSTSTLLYQDLADTLFGSNIKSSLYKCSNKECRHVFTPVSFNEDEMSEIYSSYYTHSNHFNKKRRNLFKRFYSNIMKFYLNSCDVGNIPAINKFFSYLMVSAIFLPIPWIKSYLKSNSFFLKDIKKCKMLEIGCGDGSNLKRFKDRGIDTYALDFDIKAIETAKLNGITGVVGSYEKATDFNEKFDLIVLRHVIEHVENVHDCLRVLKSVLNSDGKIVLITPNVESIGHSTFGDSWRGLEPPRHLNLFTLDSLKNVMNHQDLNVLSAFTFPSLGYSIASQSLKISGKKIPKLIKPFISIFFAYIFYFYYFTNRFSGEELVITGELINDSSGL